MQGVWQADLYRSRTLILILTFTGKEKYAILREGTNVELPQVCLSFDRHSI